MTTVSLMARPPIQPADDAPHLLLFDDDLKVRQDNRAKFILAQVATAEGDADRARALSDEVLASDPNHALAADLKTTQ